LFNNIELFIRHTNDVKDRIWRGPRDSASIHIKSGHVHDIRLLRIIACEEPGFHNNGGHVLYENGAIRLIDGEYYMKAVNDTTK
jgi:hypothetical protein